MKEYIELLLPMEGEAAPVQSKNILKLRRDMEQRYYEAPDLQKVGNNAYRFINASTPIWSMEWQPFSGMRD